MKDVELVIVQFEEVKRLIAINRVPQLRLALILLDSVTELLLHRMVHRHLVMEYPSKSMLDNFRRPTAQLMMTEQQKENVRKIISKLEANVTSNARRKKIEGSFDEKIKFLTEKCDLPNVIGPVLGKLHRYRNETYHRDQHRREVLWPAVQVYFDAACEVLAAYRVEQIAGDPEIGPELQRFVDGEVRYFDPAYFTLPEKVARTLRAEAGLDVQTVARALSEHLVARIEDFLQDLDYIEDNTPGAIPGDAIRIIQLKGDYQILFKPEVMRSRDYPVKLQDVEGWKRSACALRHEGDKYALFAHYSAIEDDFEPLELAAQRSVEIVDTSIQLSIDIARGK